MAELILWLDSYDDIYSDFDSRHYLKRNISEDFLDELRTNFRRKQGPLSQIVLMVPAAKRNIMDEKLIVAKLKEYFSVEFLHQLHKLRTRFRKNILFIGIGILIMSLNLWSSQTLAPALALNMARIVLEPAGWFFVWVALEFFFYELTGMKKEKNWWQQLSSSVVRFSSESIPATNEILIPPLVVIPTHRLLRPDENPDIKESYRDAYTDHENICLSI